MRGGALFAIVLIVCVALAAGVGLLILSMVNGDSKVVADEGLPSVAPWVSDASVRALMTDYFQVKSNCRRIMEAVRVDVPNELVSLDRALTSLSTSLKDQVRATKAKEESYGRRKAVMTVALAACNKGTWVENPPESILL